MKKLLLVIVFGLLTTLLFSQEKIEKRGFYFGIGGGAASVVYPEPLNSDLETIEDSGVDRMTIEMDLSVGGAVSDKSYLVGSVSVYGDRLEDSTYYIQFNTVLYAIGIRYYPFTTGLVLGGDVGSTRMVIQSQGSSDAESDYGFGYDILIAYDFDRTNTGFTFQLGLKVGGYDIEGDSVGAASIFGNLIWK